MAHRQTHYRPSPLARIASGALAVYTGQQQGELARQERELQLAEMKRRQAMQAEDQAMQRFAFGANLERQSIEDQLAGDELALRNSDPNAEGFADLLSQIQGRRQQAYSNRRFGPQSAPFGQSPALGMIAPPTAGASTVFSAAQPAPGVGASPVAPSPISAPLRPVRLDPSATEARKAFASSLDDWFRQAQAEGNNEGALAIQDIQSRLAGKKMTVEQAQSELGQIVTGLKRKGQSRERLARAQKSATELQDMLQQGSIVEEFANEGSAIAGALAAATDANVEELLGKYADYRKRARLQESSSSRANKATADRLTRQAEQERLDSDWKGRETAFNKAIASKSPQQFTRALEGLQNFADRHPDYADRLQPWADIDARLQRIRYKKPVTPSTVTAEDLDHPSYEDAERSETPDERDARIAAKLATVWRKDDPEAASKSAQDAINKEWAIVKDANADDDSRVQAMNHIQEIVRDFPHLKAPTTVPKFVGSPWVRENLRLSQERLNQTLRAYNEGESKRKIEEASAQRRFQMLEKESAKRELEIQKMRKELGGTLTEIEQGKLSALRDNHIQARKERDDWANMPSEKKPDPVEYNNKLMILNKNLRFAEEARLNYLSGKVAQVPNPAPPPTQYGGPASGGVQIKAKVQSEVSRYEKLVGRKATAAELNNISWGIRNPGVPRPK